MPPKNKDNDDPEAGMKSAARDYDTTQLTRELRDLNQKPDRNLVEERRRKIMEEEWTKRPLLDRVKAGLSTAIGIESVGTESILPMSKCPFCGGPGSVFNTMSEKVRCWFCNGDGQVSEPGLRKNPPRPLDPLEPFEPGVITGGIHPKIQIEKAAGEITGTEVEHGESEMKASAMKFAGTSPKAAKPATRPGTVEGTIPAGKAHYYKLPAKEGDELKFTVYVRLAEASHGTECSFAIQDEEGGNIDSTTLYVSATGEDFDRESVEIQAEETAPLIFRIRGKGDDTLVYKIKIK